MSLAFYTAVKKIFFSENPIKDNAIKAVLLSADSVVVIGSVAGGAIVLLASLYFYGGIVNVFVFVPVGVALGGPALIIGCDIVALVLTSVKTEHIKKENPLFSFEMKAFRATGASYANADPSAIADLVYSDEEMKFACVVDGVGYNNPRMRKYLKAHFDHFIKSYEKDLREENPSSQDEMKIFFERKIGQIEAQFTNPDLKWNKRRVCPKEEETSDAIQGTFLDSDFKPAMTFVQIIKVGESYFVLSAQAGDTIAIIEDEHHKITVQNANLISVGQVDDSGFPTHMQTQCLEMHEPRRIIGFSNGIGEFITSKEFDEIATATQSDRLFHQLYKRVRSQKDSENVEVAVNGAPLKAYDPTKASHVDDMSLFVLEFIDAPNSPTDDH